jgi:peroxiredoxin Q/BCP
LKASPGDRAPAFDLPLAGGGFRSLHDVVNPGGGILLFIKDGCLASELVAAHIAPLARALEQEERLFLAVLQENEDTAREFRARYGLPYPLAYESAPYGVSRAYAIETVPTLLVVDGAGVVAERLVGFLKSDYLGLGPAIEQALALGGVPPVLDRAEELPGVRPG